MLAKKSHTHTRQLKQLLRFFQAAIGLIVVMVALSGCGADTGSTASQDAPTPEVVASPVDVPATETVPTETPLPPPPNGPFPFSERNEFEKVDGLEAVGKAFRDLVDMDESDVMVVGESVNEGYQWRVYADVTSDGEWVRYIPRLDNGQNVIGVDVIHETALEAYGFSLTDVVFVADMVRVEDDPTSSSFAILGELEGRPVARLSQFTSDWTALILDPERYTTEYQDKLPFKPDGAGEVMLIVAKGVTRLGADEVGELGSSVLDHLEVGDIVFTDSYDLNTAPEVLVWDQENEAERVGKWILLEADGSVLAWNAELRAWGEDVLEGEIRTLNDGTKYVFEDERWRRIWEIEDMNEAFFFNKVVLYGFDANGQPAELDRENYTYLEHPDMEAEIVGYDADGQEMIKIVRGEGTKKRVFVKTDVVNASGLMINAWTEMGRDKPDILVFFPDEELEYGEVSIRTQEQLDYITDTLASMEEDPIDADEYDKALIYEQDLHLTSSRELLYRVFEYAFSREGKEMMPVDILWTDAAAGYGRGGWNINKPHEASGKLVIEVGKRDIDYDMVYGAVLRSLEDRLKENECDESCLRRFGFLFYQSHYDPYGRFVNIEHQSVIAFRELQ